MTVNLPAACGPHREEDTRELERVAAALADCALSAASAEHHAGLWADQVSQTVETRLGTRVDDERSWAEPDHAAALDAMGYLDTLLRRIADDTAAVLRALVEEG